MQAPPKKVPDFGGPTIENSIVGAPTNWNGFKCFIQKLKFVHDFGGPAIARRTHTMQIMHIYKYM